MPARIRSRAFRDTYQVPQEKPVKKRRLSTRLNPGDVFGVNRWKNQWDHGTDRQEGLATGLKAGL